ncbi:MAG: TraB/GumN family protein [Hyphomonadaceae bacterium]|nr:TraB/GumN family protein [Hyphomonadaceae bacterium]
MKRYGLKTTLLVAAALLAACASGATSDTPNTVREQQFAPGPALYVARDADSTMYLFGTLHLRRPGAPWGGARAQAGIAEAEEIWTEMPISPETDAQIQQLAMQYGRAASDRPLSSYLSADENARLAAALQALGVPPNAFDGLRPWLAAVTLALLPSVRAGFDPAAGADRQIDAFGDANGKHMRAFETAEQQLGMLAGFSDDVQRQMLIESIDEAAKGSQQIERMAAAWETGDLATLEQMVVTDMRAEYPAVYEVLLADRNDAWVTVLRQELAGSGVDFIAVGAGHMLGEDGLIAQLRAAGYTVERVE